MIRYQIENLFAMLLRAQATEPTEVRQRLSSIPDPGVLPMSWTTWLLVALIQHRNRQIAIKKVIRHEAPNLLHQVIDEVRVVGNWNIWMAFPDYLIVTDGQRNRELMISRHDENHYIGRFYDRLNVSDGSPEHRLSQLFCEEPHARVSSYHDLEVSEVLERVNLDNLSDPQHNPLIESDFVVLSRFTLSHAESIQRFIRCWNEPQNRLWLCCLIGDWDAAYHFTDPQAQHELAEICSDKAAELEAIWARQKACLEWHHNQLST